MGVGHDDRPTVVMMHGRLGQSAAERVVEAARRAAGLDVLATVLATGRFGRAVVVTDDPALVAALCDWPVSIEASGQNFQFGRRLARVVAEHELERVLYIGAGSGALTPASEWVALADLLAVEPVVCANNFMSADYVAFAPGAALARIEPPATDNDLPWRLARGGGLPKVTRPRHIGGEVDIDTPTDVALLTLAPELPARLAAVVAGHVDLVPTLPHALAVLANPDARLLVAGRVGAAAWSQLESATQRYTRLVSEERGMRASGRLERGEVRSLLGALLEGVGPERFFGLLGELCDVALIDTRVLFAHLRLTPTAADRFASDQGQVALIENPTVRALTAAAATSPLPVVLGGHSLVSGGLWLLAHHLRRQREASLGVGDVTEGTQRPGGAS